MTACRWTSSTTPRALIGRHVTPDRDHAERCKGCLPCPDDHCICCGTNHVTELTCPHCIGSNRADLADVWTLTDRLPEQAIIHATAAIPGGTAAVLNGPASSGIAQQWADECGEDTSHKVDEHGTPIVPLLLLATWVEAWHDVLGTDDKAHRATVETEVRWLSEHLHDYAQHHAYPQFVEEIRAARSTLEAALLAGKRDHVGEVRCIGQDCGALLRQTYEDPRPCRHDHPAKFALREIVRSGGRIHRADVLAALAPCGRCDQGGRRDQWFCPACAREYDNEAYKLARSQARADAQPIRPGVEIARDLGISAALLRQWITRGHIFRQGTDHRGRVLLDVTEVRQHAMHSGLVQ